MTSVTLNGVTIDFPFKPYAVQEAYMSKVLECLQEGKNGVLESPTGTGKTLCLLCSSLSWLLVKKAQLQAQAMKGAIAGPATFGNDFIGKLTSKLDKAGGKQLEAGQTFGWEMPKIIYASRTHSQLSQAMQELKRTSYKHVSVAILGSRDQLCVNPEVAREPNNTTKIHMCQLKVKARTCFYYNNVEARKDDPIFKQEILDIEDLVKASNKAKCCAYYLSRELKQSADIIFMPYNYLLDPKTRKAQGIELRNCVIILDEAHNVEKMCEEAASLQLSSTDVAVCITEVTSVMQDVSNDLNEQSMDYFSDSPSDAQKDFTAEDLCILKTIFMELEKAIDGIQIKNREQGETLPGNYIFDFLGKAELTHGKEQLVIDKLDKIVQYLMTTSGSQFTRKGHALQKFSDFLRVVFNGSENVAKHREKVGICYKVHVQYEEQKKNWNSKDSTWETKKTNVKSDGKVINYWCFSPGFGMQQLLAQGVRSIILTSGTLSPLKPFISEIGIPIGVELENPHIVTGQQVCVGVLCQGPDNHPLNSSYNTRNDPKYIASLGRTIFNFSCLIPDGMLIFFPSYPIMRACRDEWQNIGLWTKISEKKPIYVEPQSKEGLINVMNEYYQKIDDPNYRGAIFMAVCRGKVSEGLDFANANGRAVLVTGLPYPPLKDARVILKQRYLQEMKAKNPQGLSGQQWYQLEASRAVNQAIGRVIRHQHDYGAIILCDLRFDNPSFKNQLSTWLKPHIKKFTNFGMVTREIRVFFKNAEQTLPQPLGNNKSRNGDYTITADTASFGTVNARSNVKVKAEEKGPTFDISVYQEGKSEAKRTEEKKDMWSMMESNQKSVINFNDCKMMKSTSSVCDSFQKNYEPTVKRRKLTVLPLSMNPSLSGPSTSAVVGSNGTENSAKAGNSKDNGGDKASMGKNYLIEVKGALNEDHYRIFTKTIQNYRKGGDFDELSQNLKLLFPASKKLQHLFIGFQHFVKKEHIASFNKLMTDL